MAKQFPLKPGVLENTKAVIKADDLEHLDRARVRAIDLVDHHDRLEAALERLAGLVDVVRVEEVLAELEVGVGHQAALRELLDQPPGAHGSHSRHPDLSR